MSNPYQPTIVHRIIDISPPADMGWDDYTVEELTERFADLFIEAADNEAAFYLG